LLRFTLGAAPGLGALPSTIETMVQHEAKYRLVPQQKDWNAVCRSSPPEEIPGLTGFRAPGSRPQASEGDFCAGTACQKPVRQCESRSRQQAFGWPQHEVERETSTGLQPADRLIHLTPKAISLAPEPKCGCVWCVAGVQGQECNLRNSSVQPRSGQARSHTNKSNSVRAQREFEGMQVPDGAAPSVPWAVVGHTLAKRKGCCCGHSGAAAKRKGFAGQTGPSDPSVKSRAITIKAVRGRSQAGSWGADCV
jgi:hypothetical protein